MAKQQKIGVIERTGDKLILPEALSYDDGIKMLTLQRDHELAEFNYREIIDGQFHDALVAFVDTMQDVFGIVIDKQTAGGNSMVSNVSINVGYEKKRVIQWGRFELPGIPGYIATDTTDETGPLQLVLYGTTRRKYESNIRELAKAVRDRVLKSSIYKGKAIAFSESLEGNAFAQPRFIHTGGLTTDDLILPRHVAEQVATSVFTPIVDSDVCRKHGIPLKRGVLFAGMYGTGKSLTATVTASLCEANGWTYIYCEQANLLAEVVQFARQYQPAVIFCEDIDRATSGKRDVELDELLNIVDGIESKRSEIMVVMTTNDLLSINPAMLRPGRLDAVIEFVTPDAECCVRLIQHYGGRLIDADADLELIGQVLEGNIPAVIREVVERAKLAQIKIDPAGPLKLSTESLLEAAQSIAAQAAMLHRKKEETEAEKVLSAHRTLAALAHPTQQLNRGASSPMPVEVVH